MPVAGPRVSQRHFVQLLTLKVAVGDAEAVVTAEFEQPARYYQKDKSVI